MEQGGYINSINLKQDTDFPYLVLNVVNENSSPRNPGFQVMHWHEDLQFIYLLAGSIEVVTLDTRTQLRAGNGIFINKNVVHLVRKPSFFAWARQSLTNFSPICRPRQAESTA